MARSAFQAYITNPDDGGVLDGAQLSVTYEAGGTATIYEQQSGGTTKDNPFTIGSDGKAVFYAEPGLYRITATQGGITSEFRNFRIGVYSNELNDITSLSSLNTSALVDGQQFYRGEFWPDTGVGSVNIKWDANEPVANHNGGTIIDPAKISELNPTTKTFGTYFTADTVSGNTGCFVVSDYDEQYLEWHGAIGDSDADTPPIIQMLKMGGVWSGKFPLYRITEEISESLTGDIEFRFPNSTFKYTGPLAAGKVIFYGSTGGSITGTLSMDIDGRAHTGIHIRNNSDQPSNIGLKITVENCRKTEASTNTDGLFVDGNFENVILYNPVMRNMVMATGAGTAGISGVAGMTIKALSSTRYPITVIIENPIVEEVYSEDATYTSDQDGIRVFGPEDEAGVLSPWRQTAQINGGRYKNCMGRSVKIQNEYSTIIGGHVERDRALSVAPWGVEFDMQTGGGQLTGQTARYTNGSVPRFFSVLQNPDLVGKQAPWGSVGQLKIYTDATAGNEITTLLNVGSRSGDPIGVAFYDAVCLGLVKSALRLNPLNGTTDITVDLDAIRCAPTTALIMADSSGGSGLISCRACVNNGPSSAPIYDRTSSTQEYEVSVADGMVNWDLTKGLTPDTQGGAMRVLGLAAQGSLASGIFRPVSFELANDATFTLPETAVVGQAGLLLVSVARDRNTQALVSVDANASIILAQGSTVFEAGTTTEPASGDFRIWSSASGIIISNRSGVDRTVTVMMLG